MPALKYYLRIPYHKKIIVSGDQEITIKSLVEKIAQIYEHNKISWLTHKPNGQMKRPSNKEILKKTLPELEFTDVDVALENTIRWFERKLPGSKKMKKSFNYRN